MEQTVLRNFLMKSLDSCDVLLPLQKEQTGVDGLAPGTLLTILLTAAAHRVTGQSTGSPDL